MKNSTEVLSFIGTLLREDMKNSTEVLSFIGTPFMWEKSKDTESSVSFDWYPHGESLRMSYIMCANGVGMTSFAHVAPLLMLSRRPLKTANP